jgi:pimeloyl-ACP methyl ester carboxylesterase
MKGKKPLVFVPGLFGNAALAQPYVKSLEALPYNLKVYTVDPTPVQWTGTLRENFKPVLEAVSQTAEKALRETGAERVILSGTSAGGRVARLWLSDTSYGGVKCGGWQLTETIIMLGAANQTNEGWSKKSVDWVNANAPGAYYKTVNYITVIGKAVQGKFGFSPEANLAAINYRVQCGKSEVWGDGVIPLECAKLNGALNLVLDGVWHVGILGKIGYETPAATAQWGKYLGEVL